MSDDAKVIGRIELKAADLAEAKRRSARATEQRLVRKAKPFNAIRGTENIDRRDLPRGKKVTR